VSYDVWLEIDTGGPEPAVVSEARNMTSNVAPMWRLAGADLAHFAGMPAVECIPDLRKAIAKMEDDPAPYRALNPRNGWGDYESCLGYLRALLADFLNHPKATVKVSR
jgi:hypothetical protein